MEVSEAPSSDDVTDVSSKTTALLKRKKSDAMVRAAVEKLVSKHVEGVDAEESVAQSGCFRITSCLPWRRSRMSRVSTSEPATAATAAAAAAASTAATAPASAASRLFGTRKTGASDASKLNKAIEMASAKVAELTDRVSLGKQRAMMLQKEGKKTEALMALRKAKANEKLLASSNAALETLEAQKDMLENAALQRELASALASTTKSIKGKTRGLVKFAEKAVDDTQELRDDAEDLNAAFEGIQPSSNVDEDELMDELNAMMEVQGGTNESSNESSQAAQPAPTASHRQVHITTEEELSAQFPSVPTSVGGAEADDEAEEAEETMGKMSQKAERKASKKPLLAGVQSSSATS